MIILSIGPSTMRTENDNQLVAQVWNLGDQCVCLSSLTCKNRIIQFPSMIRFRLFIAINPAIQNLRFGGSLIGLLFIFLVVVYFQIVSKNTFPQDNFFSKKFAKIKTIPWNPTHPIIGTLGPLQKKQTASNPTSSTWPFMVTKQQSKLWVRPKRCARPMA